MPTGLASQFAQRTGLHRATKRMQERSEGYLKKHRKQLICVLHREEPNRNLIKTREEL
jgi:hypothetical protein